MNNGNIVAHIIATSLDDAWYQILNTVIEKGRKYLITAGSFEKTHRIGMPIIAEINTPGARPLAPIMPEGSNVPPPTSEAYINEYAAYLMSPTKTESEHYTYGEDLWWQIEWVVEHYRKTGHGTNHCYMTVGRPESMLFYDRGVDLTEKIIVYDRAKKGLLWERNITNAWNKDEKVSTSSQCLRGIDTWIDNNKLHFWVYFRSWDLWGGFPANLGGIQLLKEHMAERIGIEDGPMIVSGKDLHVYEYAWLPAVMRLKKDESVLKREKK
ncbi:MAG: thymidylate synthase [Patescibacteria group bacterium]